MEWKVKCSDYCITQRLSTYVLSNLLHWLMQGVSSKRGIGDLQQQNQELKQQVILTRRLSTV